MVAFTEEQGQNKLTGLANLFRFGFDYHSFTDGQSTGGLESPGSLDFYQAEPAATIGDQCLVIAQGGDFKSRAARRLQNSCALRHFDRFIIDYYLHNGHSRKISNYG
jgi:hypothetical protein